MAKVSLRIDATEPACSDKTIQQGSALTAMVAAEEEPVFLSQTDGTKGSFGGVIVCALQGTIFPSVKIRPG